MSTSMDLSAPLELFFSRYDDLPVDLRHALRENPPRLGEIALYALESRWTNPLYNYFERIFADTCARWTESEDFARALASFGRIVPFAPHLSGYASLFLSRNQDVFRTIWTGFTNLELEEVLLAIFRLLVYDRSSFSRHFDLQLIYPGLQHESRVVQYLCMRTVCLQIQAADAAMTEVVGRLGPDPIVGQWESKQIDFIFLSLWEEKRSADIWKESKGLREKLARLSEKSKKPPGPQHMETHPLTVEIFGTLLPRLEGPAKPSKIYEMVATPTTIANVTGFTEALIQDRPVLLKGPAGSGKTATVNYCASKLNKLETMVTLHLNEQSDAKMLVGMYTTGNTPGTFQWQAGVLTTAVQEGRWLFIEDLDRAPNEVISVLLPLIERRELLLPNRGEAIQAHSAFKIIASTRTIRDASGRASMPRRNMIGSRFWTSIGVEELSLTELGQVLIAKYPELSPHADTIMTVYASIQAHCLSPRYASLTKTGMARSLTPRDLFKWCARLQRQFSRSSRFSDVELDLMFLEAVDCFAGYLAGGEINDTLTSSIAERLQIDAARKTHLLLNRQIKLALDLAKVAIGRVSLHSSPKSRSSGRQKFFAHSPHSLRLLEKLAAAVENREPVLLVGETGIGKTACIQQLAASTGQKLSSFNLSQQSESGDLLGGFKPINVRGLVMPMREEFDELFNHPLAPFAKSKDDNLRFGELLGKAIAKGQWKKVCVMWKSASDEVQKSFRNTRPRDLTVRPATPPHPNKRRRTAGLNVTRDGDEAYQARWTRFAADVRDLESHLSSKSRAFAFKFIEGSLVKAVRNGDWILLDEINLATPDTLEALVDLLGGSSDETPSLLLTESGNLERIKAHPRFRIFAAMNPATDVGKKDLPPGIRSRFTELYVESPDRDIESLQQIVRSYIPEGFGPRLVFDVTNLYAEIQKLAHSNMLVDGAGQRPHFSLRTLTRTLVFARDVAAPTGAKEGTYRRALYEGFHMSFSTLLDKASEALVAPLVTEYLFAKHPNAKAELTKPLPKPNDGRSYIQEQQYWLRRGAFETAQQPHYIITDFVRRNLNNLIRAISTRKMPILIQGPTSSGKTSMIEYLAKRSGNKFVRINNHEHTDLQEYLGSYMSGPDGQLKFQEGLLVEALRKGYWIVLDELNLAPTEVLEALNRLLDDNRELLIPETQEIISPHPDFMLFATQNPAGLYGGRKHLSRAFRNRFLELHFDDIPVGELCEILEKRTQIPPKWARRIVETYKELSSLRQETRMFEQKSFATLRDLFRWAQRKADDKQSLAINGFMLLAERVRKPEEREQVRIVIEQVMNRDAPKVRIDEALLYAPDALPASAQQQGQAGAGGVVWTKSMRRLYTLVEHAINSNEPVLLVGETGCGKTTVCQILAKVLGKDLFSVNAHQNTETGDLIGSQRPIRNRAAIELRLKEQLCEALGLRSSSDSLVELWNTFSILSSDRKETLPQGLQAQIEHLYGQCKALFEWTDGSLVNAMKTGNLFLLDEISLADDSVLERLNSVLESSRSLLLAEKGSVDALVTANDGFQFLATMNPGGDYGKRELSPALRNRFTEIWVPSLFDLDDIMEIVVVKLRPDMASYAETIVRFSSWFNARYNTSAASAISIRDVLAWIEFINRCSGQDLEATVLHGAALVYIDALGANPAAMLSIAANAIDDERSRCIHQLGQLLGRDLSPEYFTVPYLQAFDDRLTLGSFSLSRLPGGSEDNGFSFIATTTRVNAMRIFRALQLTKPLLIEGNPGVGKTTLVTAVAKAVGKKLVRINLSEQTDLMDLFGSDVPVEGSSVGTFAWRDAPFLTAMKNGDWVLLDEMNLASQSVLEGLNACLDHRAEAYIAELDQTFQRDPHFRLFAAQNPHHQGGGRKGLPASFVNRFTVVYADVFKQSDLELICKQMNPAADPQQIAALTSFVGRLESEVGRNTRFGSAGGPWEFNLRDALRWLHLRSKTDTLLAAGQDYDFCDIIFRHRFRNANDREQVDMLYIDSFSGPIPHRSFYHNLSAESYQVGMGLLPRQPLVTHAPPVARPLPLAHLPVLEALLVCVESNWPTILVGPSGGGKSAVLDYLAASSGQRIVTFSMTADVDAMDLVGGYEQADANRKRFEILALICDEVRNLLARATVAGDLQTASEVLKISATLSRGDLTRQEAQALAGALQDAEIAALMELKALLQRIVALPEQIEQAQFEWVDGLLVRALQRGDWLVLDNANLCSSSVLDRLNSLLEPNGTLSINEHPTESGQPRLVIPHPNFRVFLTMDPKNGELSRAMRNRCIELYMVSENDPGVERVWPVFAFESSMARYRNLLVLDRNSVPQQKLAAYATDHLSFSDFSLAQRFERQLEAGLLSSDPLREEVVKSMSLTSKLDETYISRAIEVQSLPEPKLMSEGNKQSIYPINNEFLVRLQSHRRALSLKQSRLARAYDILLDLAIMDATLSVAVAQAKERRPATAFDRSVRQGNLNITKTEPTRRVASYLETSLRAFQEISRKILTENEESGNAGENLQVLKPARQLWWNVFNAVTSVNADTALFQILLQLGQQALHGACEEKSNDVAKILSSQLQELIQDSALMTGKHMEQLWTIFRPQTVPSLKRLGTLQRLESLADRFDSQIFPLEAPLHDIVRVRGQLQYALDSTVLEDVAVDELIQELSAAIKETDESSEAPKNEAILKEQFEAVLQYLRLSRANLESGEMQALMVLAGRPTRGSLAAAMYPARQCAAVSRSLFEVSSLAEAFMSQQTPSPWDGSLSHSLFNKLRTLKSIPLNTLSQLKIELPVLTRLLASNAKKLCSDPCSLLTTPFVEHLKTWTENMPRTLALPDTILSRSSATPGTLGESLVKYAATCILNYVPDRPFDPALKEIIRRRHCNEARSASERKVQDLRQFELFFSGQSTSLRIQLAERDLVALGVEEVPLAIARPDRSQLHALQGDYDRVLEIVRRVTPANGDGLLADESVLQNIQLLVRRLGTSYRTYDDLVVPLVHWLRCLWLGLSLLKMQAARCTNAPSSAFDSMKAIAALPGDQGLPADSTSLPGLGYLALAHKLEGSQRLASVAHQAFRELYTTWKDQMAEEADRLAKKSSLYVFRGETAEVEDVQDEEYQELFPQFDSDEQVPEPEESNLTTDAALRIADAHGQVFDPKFGASEFIAKLIEDQTEKPGTGYQPMIDSLPNVFLSLRNYQKTINAGSLDASKYNIYHDSNVQEAERLDSLAQRIEHRFSELKAMDFDHSTVDDIMEMASKILATPYTAPLAKFLPSIEKLYSTMHEWEKIAHRGLSAGGLVTELTELIVSWRRLELSTWMQLFAVEQCKAEEDAKTWWFVAYENIIANPERLSDVDIGLHAPELLKALEIFMKGSTLGQYNQRLRILRQFERHLSACLTTLPHLGTIHHALSNFIAYFTRFDQPATEALARGRKEIEKQAREVVQLASWRDVNVESLKQSAKSSHRKLFRLVRKFRDLLSRPVASIIEQGLPEETSLPAPAAEPPTKFAIERDVLESASQLCRRELPPRFVNASTTVGLMRKLGEIPPSVQEHVDDVQDFLESLHSSIAELQKATPPMLTDDTKDKVAHLKTRKRALFADVLKQIRKWGFQFNLAKSVLLKQDSLSVVLASLPGLEFSANLSRTAQANHQFDKVLSLMPQVRELQREHSADLTPAEVQRSAGYLEGILHHIIEQRQSLTSNLELRERLETLCTTISGLWTRETQRPCELANVEFESVWKLRCRQIQWLVPMLQFCDELLKIQARFGELDAQAASSELEICVEKLSTIKRLMKENSASTVRLYQDRHLELAKLAHQEVKSVQSRIDVIVDKEPAFAAVLQPLHFWTRELTFERPSSQSTPCATSRSLADRLLECFDQVLATVQALGQASLGQSATEASSMVRASKLLTERLKVLNASASLAKLESCLSSLKLEDSNHQSMGIALFTMAQPVFASYSQVLKSHLDQCLAMHTANCKLAHHLCTSFIEIGQKGFCTPPDKSTGEGETGKEEKLEGGTGLGQGEGAEDISKDIGDDEDLTELAQEPNEKKDDDEIEDEKDAVDMADEDMEGQLGDVAEQPEDGGEQEDGSEAEKEDAEEEMGSVDDLGPEAIDEKMWDEGGKDEDQKPEKQNDKSKGKRGEDQAAAQDEKGDGDATEEEVEAEAGAQEEEAVGQQQGEQVDDYTEEADKLDLPEDMNMDGEMEKSDDESMDDLGDLDNDVEMTEDQKRDEEVDEGPLGEERQEENAEITEPEPRETEETGEADVEKDGEAEQSEEKEDESEDAALETEGLLQNEQRDVNAADDVVPSEVQGMGADEQADNDAAFDSRAKQDQGEEGAANETSGSAAGEKGQQDNAASQDAVGRNENLVESTDSQPFKRLGDALEKWFNQHRQIRSANNDPDVPQRENKQDVDMKDVDFEHLVNEESQAEAQALGVASEDQARALDETNAVETNDEDLPRKSFIEEEHEELDAGYHTAEDEEMQEASESADHDLQEASTSQGQAKAFIGDRHAQDPRNDPPSADEDTASLNDTDSTTSEITDALQPLDLSNPNARHLWTSSEAKTRGLAATLTEQLRLILSPTLSTKLRGDFRTGKRLNIKKIIPYIASGYKRDKIWLRRSVPSKRNYQVMLAVDDSRSMAEAGKKDLAFDTVAMVTKALAMLEVGELCVVGFGKDVHVKHPFDRPFTDDAGVHVFERLAFDQEDTDVRRLLGESISLFKEARERGAGSARELWQLMLIVSDAICRDTEAIMRLARRAQEERIMVVFVVVDAGAKEVDGRMVGSIMDLQSAEFKDGKVEMSRYMDVFPFKWWVLVRDVRELPGVLSAALRQWFSEVVESGSS